MRIIVIGNPAPQGSKKYVGHGVMIESSKKVKPWRDAVAAATVAARNGEAPLDGRVLMDVTFWLPKPVSLTKRRAADGPNRKPDLDKLVRSTLDGLVTGGAMVDDARVVELAARKKYVEAPGHVGAEIFVWANANERGPRPKLGQFAMDRGKTFVVEETEKATTE